VETAVTLDLAIGSEKERRTKKKIIIKKDV